MPKTMIHNDRVYTQAFEYMGVDIYTRGAPMTWLAVVGDETLVTNEAWHLYDRIGSAAREPRFYVGAMHKEVPQIGRMVDYWRVVDRETGMRADGTAKFETADEARRWCDGLNAIR